MARPALCFVGASLLLAGCQPTFPLGLPPDRSCIPDWPEACLGAEQPDTSDPEAEFECEGAPELLEGQRSTYGCLPRPEDGQCPEAESDCAADAFDNRFIVDCRDCLRETVAVACGPDPGEAEACCYRLVITAADQDGCD